MMTSNTAGISNGWGQDTESRNVNERPNQATGIKNRGQNPVSSATEYRRYYQMGLFDRDDQLPLWEDL